MFMISDICIIADNDSVVIINKMGYKGQPCRCSFVGVIELEQYNS